MQTTNSFNDDFIGNIYWIENENDLLLYLKQNTIDPPEFDIKKKKKQTNSFSRSNICSWNNAQSCVCMCEKNLRDDVTSKSCEIIFFFLLLILILLFFYFTLLLTNHHHFLLNRSRNCFLPDRSSVNQKINLINVFLIYSRNYTLVV